MSEPTQIDLRADIQGHAIDYACDLDRQWLERHPQADMYYRKPVEGEWEDPRVVRVRVIALASGVRVRVPILRPPSD